MQSNNSNRSQDSNNNCASESSNHVPESQSTDTPADVDDNNRAANSADDDILRDIDVDQIIGRTQQQRHDFNNHYAPNAKKISESLNDATEPPPEEIPTNSENNNDDNSTADQNSTSDDDLLRHFDVDQIISTAKRAKVAKPARKTNVFAVKDYVSVLDSGLLVFDNKYDFAYHEKEDDATLYATHSKQVGAPKKNCGPCLVDMTGYEWENKELGLNPKALRIYEKSMITFFLFCLISNFSK